MKKQSRDFIYSQNTERPASFLSVFLAGMSTIIDIGGSPSPLLKKYLRLFQGRPTGLGTYFYNTGLYLRKAQKTFASEAEEITKPIEGPVQVHEEVC